MFRNAVRRVAAPSSFRAAAAPTTVAPRAVSAGIYEYLLILGRRGGVRVTLFFRETLITGLLLRGRFVFGRVLSAFFLCGKTDECGPYLSGLPSWCAVVIVTVCCLLFRCKSQRAYNATYLRVVLGVSSPLVSRRNKSKQEVSFIDWVK